MFVIAIILLLTTGLFYWAAGNVNHGIYLADRLCSDALSLCDQPWMLLAGSAIAILLGLLRQMMKNS